MNLFTEDAQAGVGSLGETTLIEQIAHWLEGANPPEPEGIGDDCAVYYAKTPETAQLVTSDPILFGSHFDETLSAADCAAKLVKRNLSDIAAMGGRPQAAILSLALAPSVSLPWLESFYRAIAQCAGRYDFKVVGGDVASAPDRFFGAFMTLLGEMPPGLTPLARHRADSGCHIYVTGLLGGTRQEKHYAFEPRLAEGEWLAAYPDCLTCSDLSDGLGKDYSNILAPRCFAAIDCHAIPLSPAARQAGARSGNTPLYHAFNDGEDFELIFALSADADLPAFEAAWRNKFEIPATRIGQVFAQTSVDAPRLRLSNAPEGLSPRGYEHLR